MSPLELPRTAGSYRWYYLDVSDAEWTAVTIFMVGSLFSRRYSARSHRGALPTSHAAVNFALYRHGQRVAWALTEYDGAALSDGGATLTIGSSRLTRTADGTVTAHVFERTPWWPTPVEADITLTPRGPECPSVTLVDGLAHQWHPYAVRAHGAVRVPSHQLTLHGAGYHDGNSGPRLLGTDLPGWSWTRTHDEHESRVVYTPALDLAGGQAHAPAWSVRVTGSAAKLERLAQSLPAQQRTGWGLHVPTSLGLQPAPALLESSPFYARLEARQGAQHALGEVADFRRFHSPFVRWMADFRTRHASRGVS